MKILELFSGYGTASFALKQLKIKYELIGYSDINRYANQCFKQNHCPNDSEDKLRLGDCTKINPNDLEDFDLLTGGSPCQDFSIAGKGKGVFNDDGTLTRSGLLFEFVRILKAKKPKYFLWENVKGVITKKHRDAFIMFMKLLSNVGYDIDFKLMNTKDYGIPQNRERVFVVGFRKDLICYKTQSIYKMKPIEKEIRKLLKKEWVELCNFTFPEKEELKIFLKDILEEEVDEKYYLTEEQTKRLISKSRSFNERMCKEGIDPTLCSRDYKDQKVIQLNKSKESNNQQPYMQNRIYDSKGISPAICSVQPNILQINDPKHSNNRIYLDNGISPNLNAMQGGNRQPFIISSTQKHNTIRNDGLTNSLPSAMGKGGGHTPMILNTKTRNVEEALMIAKEISMQENKPVQLDLYHLQHGEIRPLSTYIPQNLNIHRCLQSGEPKELLINSQKIRKLTPKECFRLQGFLDDEINLSELSNTQKYKLAGNGQSVNVVVKIFKEMFKNENNN